MNSSLFPILSTEPVCNFAVICESSDIPSENVGLFHYRLTKVFLNVLRFADLKHSQQRQLSCNMAKPSVCANTQSKYPAYLSVKCVEGGIQPNRWSESEGEGHDIVSNIRIAEPAVTFV